MFAWAASRQPNKVRASSAGSRRGKRDHPGACEEEAPETRAERLGHDAPVGAGGHGHPVMRGSIRANKAGVSVCRHASYGHLSKGPCNLRDRDVAYESDWVRRLRLMLGLRPGPSRFLLPAQRAS